MIKWPKEATGYIFVVGLDARGVWFGLVFCQSPHLKKSFTLDSSSVLVTCHSLKWQSPWTGLAGSGALSWDGRVRPASLHHTKCISYCVENFRNQVRKRLWKEKYARSPLCFHSASSKPIVTSNACNRNDLLLSSYNALHVLSHLIPRTTLWNKICS